MKRAQGGYIMVVVLLCTAAISLTGALVFTQSQDQMVTTQALRNQTIAAARANLGAQRVLAELRMAVPPAYLEGLDTLALTGGIGEHDAATRAAIARGWRVWGVQIDEAANAAADGSAMVRIDAPDSRAEVWVVPTDEGRVAARQAVQLLGLV